MSSCPLCGATEIRPSWLGEVHYRGRAFPYAACGDCGSLYCSPMPTPEDFTAMYGVDYAAMGPEPYDTGVSKQPTEVLAELGRLGGGRFLDYGCGEGALLAGARGLGWEGIGLEMDPEVARRVAAATGAQVVTPDALPALPPFDAVHLGDVLEHLPAPVETLAQLTARLRPGGTLIAQGPLEANFCLFTAALQVARRVRPRRIEMAPYHVMLATAAGQRRLFERAGLTTRAYRVSEVAFPAPARLEPQLLRQPRALALFATRVASRAVSRLRPGHWGNRYFYVGVSG